MCISSSRRRRSFTLSTDTTSISSGGSNLISTAQIAPKKVTTPIQRTGCLEVQRRTVLHHYHDHAYDVPDAKIHITRGGVKVPFPVKLHQMLDKIEQDGLAHIISWQPHGRCFLVHKPKEFAEHVMPRYFTQGKFASFQRQLNLYGFGRITQGPDSNAYYHELFLRGKEFLCQKIHRTRIKGTGSRAASNPDTEPNFYAMPPVAARMLSRPPTVYFAHSSAAAAAATSQPAQVPSSPPCPPAPVAPPMPASSDSWDSCADYIIQIMEDSIELPPPSPSSRTVKITTDSVPSDPSVPVVSDDEEGPFCINENMDDLFAGVDLDSDFELGLLLEKIVE